jgi:fermentation-respiration switch protein FrsA (DUF1100 family)
LPKRSSRQSPTRPPVSGANPHEIQVSPAWLLKTVGLVIAASAFLIYIAACGLMYFAQPRFIFETSYVIDKKPSDFGAKFEDVKFGSFANPQPILSGWWLPAANTTPHTLLYLHGNAATISGNAERAVGFEKLGINVFLFDYRGFGNSLHEFPNEQRVYEDADTAWNYLTQELRLKPADIVIFGSSLGGAVAAELARRHPDAAGLILESAFTSIEDLSHLNHRFTIIPVRLLLHERLDAVSKLKQVHMPLLVIQGDADHEVPLSMAKELFAAAAGPKGLVLIPHGGHENNARANPGLYAAAVADFMRSVYSSGSVSSK